MSIINVKSTTPISTLAVVFKGSVANETEKNYGISHLMEHLQCKNLRPMYEELTKYNISHNAFTADDCIVFFMTGLEKYLLKFRNEFLDRLFEFNLTDEVLQNEIDIVLQEYLNSFTGQAEAHWLNLFRKKFQYYGPIGSRKGIENTTVEACKEYYDLQYSKPHLIVNIAQNDLETNIEFQKEYKNLKPLLNTFDSKDIEIAADFDKSVSVLNYKRVTEDFKELKIISDMLGKGLESPLYTKIREEKGLVYYVQSITHKMDDNQGFILISSEMETKNVKEFQKTFKEVLSLDLDESRFETIRQAMLSRKEKLEVLNFSDYDKYINPEDEIGIDYLNNLTFDKIQDVYKKHYCNLIESIDKEEFKEVLELPG